MLQGLRSRSAVSESTLSKYAYDPPLSREHHHLILLFVLRYFFFLIFNVLLVFTLVSTAINTVVILFKQPTEIARILATSLPKVNILLI